MVLFRMPVNVCLNHKITRSVHWALLKKATIIMEYMTVQQAADRWGISDRRVRILCADGRIKDAIKAGKSYQIPLDANKPSDKRI